MLRFIALLLALAWLILASSLTAHSAEAQATYPQKAPANSYVEVNATQSAASAGLEWQIADQEAEAWYSADRRRLLVRVPTERLIQIILIARDLDGRADVRIVSIAITDTAPVPIPPTPKPIPDPNIPGPAPGPTPPPKPDPVTPARFGLRDQVTLEAMKVTSPTRSADAELIAQMAISVRDQLKTGKAPATSALKIAHAIQEATSSLPDGIQQRWLPPTGPSFARWWTSQLRRLWDEGKLKTSLDWQDVMTETAQGLRAVK